MQTGELDAAVKKLEEATRLEDTLKYDEPPGWTVPGLRPAPADGLDGVVGDAGSSRPTRVGGAEGSDAGGLLCAGGVAGTGWASGAWGAGAECADGTCFAGLPFDEWAGLPWLEDIGAAVLPEPQEREDE